MSGEHWQLATPIGLRAPLFKLGSYDVVIAKMSSHPSIVSAGAAGSAVMTGLAFCPLSILSHI